MNNKESIEVVWQHSYKDDCLPNFAINMSQPRHRWYEFKEGFSSTLVSRAIREKREGDETLTILDPFSGSGTTPLTALQNGCNAIGFEVNPFMHFISKTKCKKSVLTVDELRQELERILHQEPFSVESSLEGTSTFTKNGDKKKWLFNLDVIRTFQALKNHISQSKEKDFFMLALITSIMQCCNAKKDGKCLRYLNNWKECNYSGVALREAFKTNALLMIDDISTAPLLEGDRIIRHGDTRELLKLLDDHSVDLTVFSPPYLNSFDYSDIYRPELFLGDFIKSNSELMELRKRTLRSHVQCRWEQCNTHPSAWVADIVCKLDTKKDDLWNSNIPNMVSSYFQDMEAVLKESYRVSKENAQIWIVVGTSAYAGIEIPVDLILADIAKNNGWKLDGVYALRKLRTSSQCLDENQEKVHLRESLIICRK